MQIRDQRGCSALHYAANISSQVKDEIIHLMVDTLRQTGTHTHRHTVTNRSLCIKFTSWWYVGFVFIVSEILMQTFSICTSLTQAVQAVCCSKLCTPALMLRSCLWFSITLSCFKWKNTNIHSLTSNRTTKWQSKFLASQENNRCWCLFNIPECEVCFYFTQRKINLLKLL